jgi:hypothetical protein
LDESGTAQADKVYKEYKAEMDAMCKKLAKVQDFMAKGELSENKKSVKSALALTELCKGLTININDTENLIPGTAREEKTKKFNKYQLGAVLIRDGFEEYERMKFIDESLVVIGKQLGDVADKQQHELFEQYSTQVKRFCDVMADLGLYEVMLKCRQFAEEPEESEESEESEPEPEPEPDPIIFVDMKTASVFSIEREEAVKKEGITPVSPDSFDYTETANDTDKMRIIRDLKDHPDLGIATQIVVQKTEVGEVNMAEAEKVAGMWGVSLKKRAKKKKGEYFVFVDPTTGATGELDRKKCIDIGFITPKMNEDLGKESLEEAETHNIEYDKLISEIRRVFGIKFGNK